MNDSKSYLEKHVKSCSKCSATGLLKCNIVLCSNCNGKKCYLCNSGYSQYPIKECEICHGSGGILIKETPELRRLYNIYYLGLCL